MTGSRRRLGRYMSRSRGDTPRSRWCHRRRRNRQDRRKRKFPLRGEKDDAVVQSMLFVTLPSLNRYNQTSD